MIQASSCGSSALRSSFHLNYSSIQVNCRYLWVYLLVLKSFLVYVSDIFTAVSTVDDLPGLSRLVCQLGERVRVVKIVT